MLREICGAFIILFGIFTDIMIGIYLLDWLPTTDSEHLLFAITIMIIILIVSMGSGFSLIMVQANRDNDYFEVMDRV